MRLPNLIFVGAEKSGSTTIHRILSKHDDIFTIRKETEFFSFYKKNKKRHYYLSSLKEYKNLFSHSENYKYRLDVSTTYLHCPDAISNIKKLAGNVKIIICLRNPVERAYSRYWMSAKNNYNLINYSKKKFINYFFNHKTDIKWSNVRSRGLYSKSVNKFLKVFGEKNVLILFYDDLVKNNCNFFEKIFNFLKIKNIQIPKFNKYAESLYSRNKFIHYLFNKSININLPNNKLIFFLKTIYRRLRSSLLHSYPDMGNEERRIVLNFYLNDIKKLEKKLNKNLEIWKV